MSSTMIRKGNNLKQRRLGPLASGAAAVVLFLTAGETQKYDEVKLFESM